MIALYVFTAFCTAIALGGAFAYGVSVGRNQRGGRDVRRR